MIEQKIVEVDAKIKKNKLSLETKIFSEFERPKELTEKIFLNSQM